MTHHNDTLSDAFTHPAIKHELVSLREEVKRLRQDLKDANETTLVIARQRDELQEKYDRIRRGPPPVQAANQRVTFPACPTHTFVSPDVCGCGKRDAEHDP